MARSVLGTMPARLAMAGLSMGGYVAMEVMRQAPERGGRDALLRQQAAIIDRPDSLPGLPGIAGPTLVLCGRQDGPTPVECHREIAAALPGARLIVIENSGHLTPMERPLAGLSADEVEPSG